MTGAYVSRAAVALQSASQEGERRMETEKRKEERERDRERGTEIWSIKPWTVGEKNKAGRKKQFCVRESGEAEEVR